MRFLVPNSTYTMDESQAKQEEFKCTMVIGFSQTRQWFSDVTDFEEVVGNDKWELLWQKGAAIDRWADPNFSGWNKSIDSPCGENPNSPDRILLTISGSTNSDPTWWANEIRAAITVIRDKYPSVRQIILQPVIGGPDDGECFFNGQKVRASVNHPVIDQAISMVVGGDVVAGMSPEVISCDDFRDAKGHIKSQYYTPEETDEQLKAISRKMGEFYAKFQNDVGSNDTIPPESPKNVNVSESN